MFSRHYENHFEDCMPLVGSTKQIFHQTRLQKTFRLPQQLIGDTAVLDNTSKTGRCQSLYPLDWFCWTGKGQDHFSDPTWSDEKHLRALSDSMISVWLSVRLGYGLNAGYWVLTGEFRYPTPPLTGLPLHIKIVHETQRQINCSEVLYCRAND